MVTTAAKWRIGFLLFAVLFLLVTLLSLVVRFAAESRAGVIQTATPHLIPNTDVNPFGANFFLQWEAEPFKREKTVEMAAQAGIGWAKQQFPWEDIEPSPGQYRWEKYDDIVDIYRKHELQVIARLDRPPGWTRADNRLRQRPPDDFNDYGDFVEQFVRHFQGRVRYIQIWNEPNIYPEWGDQPVNPAAYTQLLEIAYRRAKSVDPNVYVLSAPLAINLENFPARRNLSDLAYLEEMYQAGAGEYFDILSANAFGMDRPPEDPPDPGVLNFRRVELQREIMVRHGDGDKPIWFNEYGWNAAPTDLPPEELIWQRVSEEQQALWTVEGVEWARNRWPWAGVFNIWYFRQIGNISTDQAHYYFRMVDVDFTPRRVYHSVQQATQNTQVAMAGYYQETAPAVRSDHQWEARIEPQASARADVVATTPGATLTFEFEGTGVDLIAFTGPEAGRLAAAIDDKPVPGLARDGAGRSILDLEAPEPVWQSRIAVARDGPAGRHTLRLTLVDGEAAVDGFVTWLNDRPILPVVPVSACVLGLLTAGGLLWREVARIAGGLP
ncbi:MAG: beta-galactosidase [Anaerolineae bacterium]